ncbi:hypothetical protein NM688_g9030 [Phlebia brevispora]|uniref:Uncharacterized protein n=1 Tax=Phlebia brevispora TaxID=194682 RepID=A0ACC1RKX8_9APHY|nr:hypothetical protein NM688_g9030 [Phlebia brevispora]
MDYDLYDALLHHIFKQTQGDAWFKPSEENIHAGVCLRVETGHFRVFPYDNRYLEPFEAAVRALNPVVAVKVRSAAVHAALATVTEDADCIYVDHDTRIQILDTMSWLPRADKEQCGAFIRDERVLVVWAYDADQIINMCQDFENKLIKLLWRKRAMFLNPPSATNSNAASNVNLTEKVSEVVGEKEVTAAVEKNLEKGKDKKKKRGCRWGFNYFVSSKDDVEKAAEGPSERPMRLFAPFYSGLSAAMSVFFVGSGVAILVEETVLDGLYTRFALLVTAPLLFCISLFFCLQMFGNLSMIIGPVAQYHQNSKYYSATKPAPNSIVDANLPHITIEMPVYKESLKETM